MEIKISAKQQAMKDMVACGISTQVLLLEDEILQITCTVEVLVRPDFRKYNGGQYTKIALIQK